MFLIIFLSVVGFFTWYGVTQLLGPANLSTRSRICVGAGSVFIVLATPATILLRRMGVENMGVDLMAWLGYIGLGVMSTAVTFLLIRDIIRLVLKIVTVLHKIRRPPISNHTNSIDPDRRKFILNSANAGILTGTGLLTGYGMIQAKKIPDVKTVPVFFDRLPPDLENFRIVQITDIHVSPTIKRDFVQHVVDVVNSLSPDIVALTGDLVDGSVKYLSADVEPLKHIESGYGNYFVTGNHEYYSGVTPWINKIRSLGFSVLLNENKVISHGGGKILLAGVPDLHGGRFLESHQPDAQKAIHCTDFTHVKILLAHQPAEIHAASRAGFDLQISGHTHGGQFFPWQFLVTMAQPYLKGLHTYKNTQIYISSGTGYWGPPVRIGSRSEITLITLKNRIDFF